MDTWFTLNLGDAMLAEDALELIKQLFAPEYLKSHHPKDMAVFFRHESEGRLHCEINVYFSPASAVVALAVDAVTCPRPSPDELGLLAGYEDSWSILFQKSDDK
jgi:hypothetical protein